MVRSGGVRREHRKPTRAELALITTPRPVVRRVTRRRVNPTSPDARRFFYPNRKHMFAPSEGG
jgi:hypothetical protein